MCEQSLTDVDLALVFSFFSFLGSRGALTKIRYGLRWDLFLGVENGRWENEVGFVGLFFCGRRLEESYCQICSFLIDLHHTVPCVGLCHKEDRVDT